MSDDKLTSSVGTAEQFVGAIDGQFHPDYGPMLRGFFGRQGQAQQVTGITAQDAGTAR